MRAFVFHTGHIRPNEGYVKMSELRLLTNAIAKIAYPRYADFGLGGGKNGCIDAL